VLLVIATLVGGSVIQAFIPECGAIVASGVCDPALIYFATGAVAVLAVAVEVVLGSRNAAGRPCPSCNAQVPTGRTRCEGCGYDFAAAARPDP
jgi:hypothetical protein